MLLKPDFSLPPLLYCRFLSDEESGVWFPAGLVIFCCTVRILSDRTNAFFKNQAYWKE